MAIRQFKPVTKSSRFRSVPDFAEITRTTPEKSLLEPLKKSGGRDNHGHISMRRRGGGHKRHVPGHRFPAEQVRRAGHGAGDRVRSRTARRASRWSSTRTARSATSCIRGDWPWATRSCRARARTCGRGTRMPLREVPLGTDVHNVELKAGKGGQIARSAGASAEVVAKEGEYVTRAAALDRDAAGARQLSGDDRDGRERRARVVVVGQGGQDAVDGAASEGARRGDESRRPPARRPDARRAQRRESVGQEGRRQDA